MMIAKLLSRVAATLFGLKCDRCGCRGATLTITADRTARTELDGGRVRRSTYTVKDCSALCPRCRRLR